VNSRLWHSYCVSPAAPEPTPLSLRQWKTLSQANRRSHTIQLRKWLAQFYIETPELRTITKALSKVVDGNRDAPPGAKDIALITGPFLAGKSTLTKRWARDRYIEWTSNSSRDARGRPVWHPDPGAEYDECPVVWINLQAGSQKTDFDSQLLTFFGLPDMTPTRKMTDAAIGAARRHRVRIVVVDDVNLMKTDLKKGREVLDHIKHVNTELGEEDASVVLVGADLAGGDLVSDPQIKGRLKSQIFPRYDADNDDGKRSWQRILRGVETRLLPHLPAGKDGMLYTRLAGELWYRTQGYLGDLNDLIMTATLDAVNDGAYRIVRRHLDAVVLSDRAQSRSRKS
jgi:hypothetical protein